MAELTKEITVKLETEVVRRQILVIKTPFFMTAQELSDLRERVERQMTTGLVILSGSYDAFTVDNDAVAEVAHG